jgi:hypothetical protein
MSELANWEADEPVDGDAPQAAKVPLSAEDREFFLTLPSGHLLLGIEADEVEVAIANLHQGGMNPDWS